ncbi:MAG: right-handed parallel beta-helix repeat-containing protein [Anaerolineae bacterium]|nr:right-handed parallel beta-helix repeat-containing protein [Anaerolineae bacterium]
MTESSVIRYRYVILGVLVGLAAVYILMAYNICKRDESELGQKTLSPSQSLFDGGIVAHLSDVETIVVLSVEKSVIPNDEVRVTYGDELTYTVVISTLPGGVPIEFYDPLKNVTFKRFVERPPGITYTQSISGGMPVSTITGTLTVSSIDPVTVSFAVQIDTPNTFYLLMDIVNQARVCLSADTMDYCVWSNEVATVVYWPLYAMYLPSVLKRTLDTPSYYVDCKDGRNSNPGTSPLAAWRTLAPVKTMDFAPGDTIRLKRGCMWTGGLTIGTSGTEDDPITFTAYGEGNAPSIANPGSWTHGIIIRANHVIVENLKVQNVHVNGVWIRPNYAYNIIRNLEVTDTGAGITLHGHHNLVENCYIHDLHMVVSNPGGDNDYGATAIKFNGPYNEAAYNHIEHCAAPSEDYGTDGGGFELLGTADHSYIHHNYVADTGAFMEAGGNSANDVIFAYNVSVDNGRFSWLHLIGKFEGVVENMRVEHNTIIETGSVPHWVIFGFAGSPDESTFLLRNNIIYANERQVISSHATFTHDYNVYYLAGDTKLGFTLGEAEQIADPLFADLANRDFHLQAYSPAIDGGIDLGYAKDFDDNPVPMNESPDLGAFEHTDLPVFPPVPTPLPTPGSGEIIIDDADIGFSTSFSQDAWQKYIFVGGDHYGDVHYYNRERSTGQDTATWIFTVPQPGRYEVYAWWWAGDWRPTDVPYTINHLNGAETVRVDQQTDGAQWNLLGIFEFQDHGSVVVSDDVSNGRDIAADAIKLVYVPDVTYGVSTPETMQAPDY